jgi:hypothetical protein
VLGIREAGTPCPPLFPSPSIDDPEIPRAASKFLRGRPTRLFVDAGGASGF